MNDLEKLFENAPEGATELGKMDRSGFLAWFNSDGDIWIGYWKDRSFPHEVVATRPQKPRKTVEDAVEHYGGVWPKIHGDCLAFNPRSERFGGYISRVGHNEFWHHVCTREQFEACVAAKSEPEWTHEYRLGNSQNWFPCSIATEVGTQGVVIKCDVFEGVQYCSYNGEQAIELKPIKPTISKAEAWDKLNSGEFYNAQYGLDQIKHYFDITD